MDERRRFSTAKTAQYMRGVQHRASRFALTLAVANERKQEDCVEASRQEVDATFAEWSAHLSKGVLDQDGLRRFAENIAQRERQFSAAQEGLDEATKQRHLADQADSEAQVRLRQATSLLRTLQRNARRKRDERALQSLEDRISYDQGERR
jgi:hypothetical protein